MRHPGILVLSALALACRTATAPAPAPTSAGPAWPYSGRAQVAEGRSAMVVSGNSIASEVGRAVLRDGGNAVDAAVAVGFALAVVHPQAGNIGGGGFLVARLQDGTVRALDYRETAPAAATRDMYLDAAGKVTDHSATGHLSVGVPGSVAGLVEAHRRLGRLPWRRLVEPAIRLARGGFVVDTARRRSLASDTARLARFPASARSFLPGGRLPEVGDRLVQEDLARTLEAIRDHADTGFYHGWVADSLVAEMRRGGGIVTHADLAGYRALWREPVRVSYRGYSILSMSPASSGGVTMGLMLNILGGYPSLPPFGTPALLHLEAETMRRAFIDRNRWLGDPAFVTMPIDRLLSSGYAAELRGQIDPARATPTPPFTPGLQDGPSTTHYSVVDAEGAAVAVTTTLNDSYGSAVTVSGAGFLLNDEMDDFAAAPGQPNMYGLIQGEANTIAPGKRMLSAMSPTIVLDPEGRLHMVVGTPGGPTIISQVYHVLSNVIDHGMGLVDAVAAPRLHHQALPDQIQIEPGFPDSTLAALRAMGHDIRERGGMGDVQAIIRTPRGWLGVSDPRGGGGGAGY